RLDAMGRLLFRQYIVPSSVKLSDGNLATYGKVAALAWLQNVSINTAARKLTTEHYMAIMNGVFAAAAREQYDLAGYLYWIAHKLLFAERSKERKRAADMRQEAQRLVERAIREVANVIWNCGETYIKKRGNGDWASWALSKTKDRLPDALTKSRRITK